MAFKVYFFLAFLELNGEWSRKPASCSKKFSLSWGKINITSASQADVTLLTKVQRITENYGAGDFYMVLCNATQPHFSSRCIGGIAKN